MKILEGTGVSPGIGIAPAYIVERGEIVIDEEFIAPEKVVGEIERFRASILKSKEQLARLQASVAKAMGDDTAGIIEAQLMLASDVSVIDETEKIIKKKLLTAESAFDIVLQRNIEALQAIEDALMADRVHDLRDIRKRVLINLLELSHHTIHEVPEDRILVIQHLAPSETAHLFHNKFVGIALEMGGTTSHVAIMTRTMEIPCVLGLDGITEHIPSGKRVIIDGTNGKVIIDPDEKVLAEYRALKNAREKRREWIDRFIDKPAVTKDGHKLLVGANMELPEEVESVLKYRSDGVGLFRTELIYTDTKNLPDEEKQTRIYQTLADKIAPKSAIIRTFDIGGDKFTEILGKTFEQNPFLGWRAIRIGLSKPWILKTQLRAILRAAYKRNIKIMFPMISNIDEVKQAIGLIEESREELHNKGIPCSDNLEVGVMIEIPSAALLAREIAKKVDFFSIGTNDLIQYTLAVDRGNQYVRNLYQSYNPAVLKLVNHTIKQAHAGGIWCGICGELAADPRATIMLAGMGIDEMSVNPPSVPKIKGVIRSITIKDARRVAEECLHFSTQDEVLGYLNNMARELLPEEFFDGYTCCADRRKTKRGGSKSR